MRGRVSARLNEGATGPVFYPTGEITTALNEGLRFFVLLTLGLETTASWPLTPATTFYHMLAIFPDWIVPLRITTALGAKVRPARLEELTCLDAGWRARPGVPVRYAAVGADLTAMYQQPAAAGTVLRVTYARSPLVLAGDGDVPEIPDEYHPRLVDYGVYRMRQVEGAQELEKALKYLDSFMDGAQHYAAYVRARNLGARYDKVPLELEKFDRSRLLTMRPDAMPGRNVKGN